MANTRKDRLQPSDILYLNQDISAIVIGFDEEKKAQLIKFAKDYADINRQVYTRGVAYKLTDQQSSIDKL